MNPALFGFVSGNLRCICSDNGNASQGADNTSVRAGGGLSVGITRFLNKSQHFTVHLFRPWRPGSGTGSDGGPRRFTEVVPTPHATTRPVASEDEAGHARSCAWLSPGTARHCTVPTFGCVGRSLLDAALLFGMRNAARTSGSRTNCQTRLVDLAYSPDSQWLLTWGRGPRIALL